MGRRTQMKITRLVTTAVAAVVVATISFTSAPIASAYPNVGKLGSTLQMTDSVGQVVLSWTVNNLKPSSDTIPDLPVYGKHYEATDTVKAIQGPHAPQLPGYTAVPPNQAAHGLRRQAATPQGISGATIPQGQQSS